MTDKDYELLKRKNEILQQYVENYAKLVEVLLEKFRKIYG